ncbi:MAG: hypothetical protein CMC36_01120 [Flavobacteriaceae bacterium]|nr:hypothetical protein [Flavobacteriaceae bacterium]MAU30498.1 hypothetical protein [Flavobacteriaceae bacterium]
MVNSCEYDFQIDRKISVDEFINEELKSFNWSEVDQYPVFENCLELNSVSQKNKCFVETITNNFTANLKKNNLILNRTLVDTVNLVLMVDKTGLISIESINILDKNHKYKEVIISSFNNTVSNFPKLYPAIKRGQQVDVIFKIPIIISTE